MDEQFHHHDELVLIRPMYNPPPSGFNYFLAILLFLGLGMATLVFVVNIIAHE
jgi:hypothetical protein